MTAAHYKGGHPPGNDLGLHYTALPPIVASCPYSDQLLVTRKFWSPGANRPSQANPEAEEFALLVKRQLGVADIVAGVLVGLDRLAALAGPFDWPAQFLRREQHQPMLRILPALGAEPAADITGNDPDLAFRDFENTSGERLTHPVRILHIGVEGEAVLARVPHADSTARLHEMRIDPADDVRAIDDVRC